MLKFKFH